MILVSGTESNEGDTRREKASKRRTETGEQLITKMIISCYLSLFKKPYSNSLIRQLFICRYGHSKEQPFPLFNAFLDELQSIIIGLNPPKHRNANKSKNCTRY